MLMYDMYTYIKQYKYSYSNLYVCVYVYETQILLYRYLQHPSLYMYISPSLPLYRARLERKLHNNIMLINHSRFKCRSKYIAVQTRGWYTKQKATILGTTRILIAKWSNSYTPAERSQIAKASLCLDVHLPQLSNIGCILRCTYTSDPITFSWYLGKTVFVGDACLRWGDFESVLDN